MAALLLALAQTMGGAYISLEWSSAFLLVVMVAIILWRPYGLFQSMEQAGGDPLSADHLLGRVGGLAGEFMTTALGRLVAAPEDRARRVVGRRRAGALLADVAS